MNSGARFSQTVYVTCGQILQKAKRKVALSDPPKKIAGTGNAIIYNIQTRLLVKVVQWLALWPHSDKVAGSIPGLKASLWSVHVLSVSAWLLSGFSRFLPQSKNMHVGNSELSVGVCERVNGCLSMGSP